MKRKSWVVFVGLMMILAGGWGLGQQEEPGPAVITVAMVKVKYDMMPEFEALLAQMATAMKEAGLSYRHVWQVARGATNEFHIVTAAENYAAFDQPSPSARAMGEGDWARWVSRMTRCIDSREVVGLRPRYDLTIPAAEGKQPNLAVITTRQALPGRGAEYAAWLRDKWIPAAKKAGVEGHLNFNRRFGGAPAWITVQFRDNWAELDQRGFRARLSEEERAALAMPDGPLTTTVERLVLRFRPELSVP